MKRDFVIVLVDRVSKPWPPSWKLVETGVSVRIAADYDKIRRSISPGGLKRRYSREKLN